MLSETLPGISNTFKRNCEIGVRRRKTYLGAKKMLAAAILTLPPKNILTFEKRVEVESLSSTVTLLVSWSPSAPLIIAAAPFAISVAICNGHNVQSRAVVFVSGC